MCHGVFNVKNYGAVGDQVHDDTTAFQAALDAAGPNQVVYAPPGQYLISNLVVAPEQVLCGAGRDQTILRGKRGSSGAFITDNGSASKIFLWGLGCYLNHEPGYTDIIRLGYNNVLFGTEGYLADLWLRDAPNAVGLHVNGNVGYGSNITIQSTADGFVCDGNANIWHTITVAGCLGGDGHKSVDLSGCDVHGMHIEAPASSSVPLYFRRESSLTGVSFSLANDTVLDHVVEIDIGVESWQLQHVSYLFGSRPASVRVSSGNIKVQSPPLYLGGNASGGSYSGNGCFSSTGLSTLRTRLFDGLSTKRGVLKLWDAAADTWQYLYIENGRVRVSPIEPT